MNKARIGCLLSIGIVFCLAATGTAAAADTAIANDGTLFRAKMDSDSHRILLEVRRPDVPAETLVVPTPTVLESSTLPRVEADGTSVYLLWIGKVSYHYAVYVASWSSDSGWGETLEISGDPFSVKVNPEIAVTRDSFLRRTEDGDVAEGTRTILHLVWWDEGAAGPRPLYLPLTIIDGSLSPLSRPLDLYELDASDSEGEGFPAPASLATTPHVVKTDHGIRLGFVSETQRDFQLLDVRVPSETLRSIGDEARAQVVIFGRENPGAPRAKLAAHARAGVLAAGKGLVAEDVAGYIASEVQERLLGMEAGADLESIADAARAQVIIFGSRFQGGLRNLHQPARAQVIIFGQRDGSEANDRSALLERQGLLELPSLPEGSISLFGPDRLIIAWDENPRVLGYIEHSADSDGKVHRLRFSEDFTREQALDSLRNRVSSD